MPAPVRSRRPRGSITPEAVISGAFELAREESVDGLSMPRLARHLDVGVTSLYWYFKSKEELLDALTEEAFKLFYSQMAPLTGRHWDDVLREFFRDFRRILRNDDVLCDLCIMRTMHLTEQVGELTLARVEQVVGVLVEEGFQPESAYHAYTTLSVYTRGSLFIERLIRANGIAQPPVLSRSRKLPILAHHFDLKGELSMVSDEDFEFGLENAIRGLRALRTAEKRKR